MFIVIAFTAFQADRFRNFAPLGLAVIGTGAGLIFFSYIGLDAVSTAATRSRILRRRCRAPSSRLLIVTATYCLVALAALGAQNWELFEGQEAGLAQILDDVTKVTWWSTVLAAGAVISIFSVTLVTMYGETRILFAMGRDGLLPSMFAKVEPKVDDAGEQHHHRGHRGVNPRRIHSAGLPGEYGVDRHPDSFIVVSIGVIISGVRNRSARGFRCRCIRHSAPCRSWRADASCTACRSSPLGGVHRLSRRRGSTHLVTGPQRPRRRRRWRDRDRGHELTT